MDTWEAINRIRVVRKFEERPLNMALAAWELGIGSVPATAHNRRIAQRLLGLPSGRRCDFLLSFGYPADKSKLTAPNKPGGRLPLEDLVHEDSW